MLFFVQTDCFDETNPRTFIYTRIDAYTSLPSYNAWRCLAYISLALSNIRRSLFLSLARRQYTVGRSIYARTCSLHDYPSPNTLYHFNTTVFQSQLQV
jgi:hypothetical protein